MKKLLLVLVFALSALFGADNTDPGYGKLTTADIVKSLADTIKNLPMRLDEETVLSAVKPNGDILEYHYIINDIDDDKLEDLNDKERADFKDILKAQVADGTCANEYLQALLFDLDVKFKYIYKLENGKEYFDFIHTKAQCPQPQ